MKRIFISDLHLDENREDLTRAFIDFLETRLNGADELYILGDLFEVWLGDDHESPFNTRIKRALSSLNCQVYLMHGNRDFLLGRTFCEATGARLLEDPTEILLGRRRALLMHGDSLCTMDAEYMKARAVFRSSAFQDDFLAKPVAEREAFARKIRGESAAHARETAEHIMDVTPSEVERIMRQARVDLLIHGHTHRPDEHEVDLGATDGKRIVLGDWHTSTYYLEANDDALVFRHHEFG